VRREFARGWVDAIGEPFTFTFDIGQLVTAPPEVEQ
jgi:hypothetical protein